MNNDAVVMIFLGLSAFNKKSRGLKKIPPPIPTIPEINPRREPIKSETNNEVYLFLYFHPHKILFSIKSNIPAIDKTKNNKISNISLFILKYLPKMQMELIQLKMVLTI